MAYKYSSDDRNNLNWFNQDNTVATLKSISLNSGSLRGLSSFSITFNYPITAIAGTNGSGKSTILAMASCGYHNVENGYRQPNRKYPYYTYSDFFFQSSDEVSPSGLSIRYGILHNKWYRAEAGLRYQVRRKKRGGKWNNYNRRVRRNVVYLEMNRVVPHSERSVSRSYRNLFKPDSIDSDIVEKICNIAGRIFDKNYKDFTFLKHAKYHLPFVESSGVKYSGFNMGAGENAVFEILATIYEAGKGSLLVIDEIELGLHPSAQTQLIVELKKLCRTFHSQVICSTHSKHILESLPPEGRFYIDRKDNETTITPGISGDYAAGKLSGINSQELDIFVEDQIAKNTVLNSIHLALRERCSIIPIGSDQAVIRQLSSRYVEKRDNCIVFLDGDKRKQKNSLIHNFKNYIETKYRDNEQEADLWAGSRLFFLPGESRPEQWLIRSSKNAPNLSELADQLGCTLIDLTQILNAALRAKPHNEFYDISQRIHMDIEQTKAFVIKFACKNAKDETKRIRNTIQQALNDLG